MAGLTNNAKNLMLDALAAVAVFASAHSGNAGTTGANEISGGSPAYARKAITWNAASGGALDNNANPVFDIPGGSTVAEIGLSSALSGGTFYGSADVTDEAFAGQGTYTVTDFDITLT